LQEETPVKSVARKPIIIFCPTDIEDGETDAAEISGARVSPGVVNVIESE
jgi:hypothetical protein